MNTGTKYLFKFECNNCNTIKDVSMTIFDINSFIKDIEMIGWYTECNGCNNKMHAYVSHEMIEI